MTVNSNSKYKVSGFKRFSKLCQENNGIYDFNKFMKDYRSVAGDYYTYDSLLRTYTKIFNEKELLQKIEASALKYDVIDNEHIFTRKINQ